MCQLKIDTEIHMSESRTELSTTGSLEVETNLDWVKVIPTFPCRIIAFGKGIADELTGLVVISRDNGANRLLDCRVFCVDLLGNLLGFLPKDFNDGCVDSLNGHAQFLGDPFLILR